MQSTLLESIEELRTIVANADSSYSRVVLFRMTTRFRGGL